MLANKKILLVVAHPDDELLGPGGTMHKLIRENGCSVRAVILGEGITSRSDARDPDKWKEELDIHRSNIHAAADILGFESVGIYNFADNRFDSVDLLDIVKVVEKEKTEFSPDIIFTHHGGDLNIDHQLTFQAVMTATRPLEGEIVKTVITFETPSSTEWQAFNHPVPFHPNFFYALDEQDVKAKQDAMACYQFEKRDFPHPRSSEALETIARRWGSVIGSQYAEAFMLIRYIH